MAADPAERLRRLLDPASTAVLTMEVQQGVVGPTGPFPALVELADEMGLVATIARLCDAARSAGAAVVHATMENRGDGRGQSHTTKVGAITRHIKEDTGAWPTEAGTPGAELMPEVVDRTHDLVVPRMHGMTPFTRTSLDQVVRNLGVRTVITTGVSVNLGVLGMAISASDLGYHVIVPRDAVCGVPADYAEAVIDNSLAMIATITTVDEIVRTWSTGS